MAGAAMSEVTRTEIEGTGIFGEAERRRLVRLCAVLTGDPAAAEDLAQETLLEAWRNVHKLHDPSGADRWLNAIARNVCLRRLRRGHGEAPLDPTGLDGLPAGGADLDVELERAELAELVDRALALLPPATRDVLVQRYVHESSPTEIGARLGLSADAVSMRLARGKAVLRRLLHTELRDEAGAHDLLHGSDERWRESRVWCAMCGRRKLLVRRDPAPGVTAFRCPGCCPDASEPTSVFQLANPFFARLLGELVRPSAILARAAGWSWRYFCGGAGAARPCTRCGRTVRLAGYVREGVGDRGRSGGLYAACASCGEEVSCSIAGLALAHPDVQSLRRDHPQTRALPVRQVESGGAPAVVSRFVDLRGGAGVDVVLARDTLRVLHAG